MKIIGAGMPRTATTTQKIVLEQLGLPCYHMQNWLMNIGAHNALWREAFEGGDPWDELLEGKESTVDWPAAYFYEPLMERYPEAKVLLSVRDHEKWATSMFDTIVECYFGHSAMYHLIQARRMVDPDWADWYDLLMEMNWAGPKAVWRNAQADRKSLIAAAERWDEKVKATVPADRLIVWEPKDGWEPICEPLGIQVPDEPVPNVNDTQSFKNGLTWASLTAVNSWWESEHGALKGEAGPQT